MSDNPQQKGENKQVLQKDKKINSYQEQVTKCNEIKTKEGGNKNQ